MTTKQMHEGVGGNGKTVFLVVTVEVETGRWLWTEVFTNKSEANHWMLWA